MYLLGTGAAAAARRVLLPATTALGTAAEGGRELGVKAGANVVMPNLSPENVREKYLLYDNKIHTGREAAECLGASEGVHGGHRLRGCGGPGGFYRRALRGIEPGGRRVRSYKSLTGKSVSLTRKCKEGYAYVRPQNQSARRTLSTTRRSWKPWSMRRKISITGELVDEILNKARLRKGLSHREAAVLLDCDLEDKNQEIYALAEQIKKDFYGNRIVMFAPLYLSNYCVNGCVYCPLPREEQAHRQKEADPGGDPSGR